MTCTTTRRVYPCDTATTVEPGVRFWLVPNGTDMEGGIASDSPGLSSLYGGAPAGYALFKSADRVTYYGFDHATEVTTRSGSSVTVREDFQRAGTPPEGCTVPLVHVVCSGTTLLGM